MAEHALGRARACLVGLAAVAVLWALMLAAAGAASAQDAARRWDRRTAESLLAYAERADRHGLDPADYAPAELEWAIASGDATQLERQATDSFARLAGDLALGRVRAGRRGRYYIPSDTIDPERMARLIDVAIALGSVAQVLDGLAPRNRDYAALRAALAKLGPQDQDKRRKLEASLERWRWLPRELGRRHVMVNIPEYRLRVIEDDSDIADHRVIVGKPATPTPQFSAEVTAVILNPSWHVPQSIIAESVGSLVRNRPGVARARGYTWSSSGGALRVTQQPGPQNALGQMKLEMTNPLSIYIHDTPSKQLFEQAARTFSHGCIRTQHPFDLAEVLLKPAGVARSEIDDGVATQRTRRLPLAAPVRVYAVYLTAVAEPDGSVRYLDDPYRLDGLLAAQLD